MCRTADDLKRGLSGQISTEKVADSDQEELEDERIKRLAGLSTGKAKTFWTKTTTFT